jgi:hypothetical protein
MGDLINIGIDLIEKAYTPDEVWSVVDRIPNTAATHWDVFGKGVLPAVQNLLLQDHPEDAHDIALVWAQRSPKFDRKAFDQRWRQLVKSPMIVPGMATLQKLAGEGPEASGAAAVAELLRMQFDALRQACAAIAGKLRSAWLKDELERAQQDGWPLSSQITGAPLTATDAAVCYASDCSLDWLAVLFCEGMQRMPSDFKLVKATTGGSRFVDPADAELFEACHRHHHDKLRLCSKPEAVAALRPVQWEVVREHLMALKADLER